jgi:hypothetical protein
VAQQVEEMVGTDALLRIFPQAQRATLENGKMRCNARARIHPKTRLWEAFNCSATCTRQSDFLRHLRTCHLGGKRPEQLADERRTQALGKQVKSCEKFPLICSDLASTSTFAPQPPIIAGPQINGRKRRRQNNEDEDTAGEDEEAWDNGPNRKGKKARRG